MASPSTRNALARVWSSLETWKLSSPSTFCQDFWPYILQGNKKTRKKCLFIKQRNARYFWTWTGFQTLGAGSREAISRRIRILTFNILILELQRRQLRKNENYKKYVFLIITRHHGLGFGRNLGEILPTSLPELPIQLRDLRNSQKLWKLDFKYPKKKKDVNHYKKTWKKL